MNVARKMNTTFENRGDEKNILTLVPDMTPEEKMEAEERIKQYLNEKLTYFYNNGGPIMDI
jgi:vacuolar-type H+-ATPase subunit F/Vma7